MPIPTQTTVPKHSTTMSSISVNTKAFTAIQVTSHMEMYALLRGCEWAGKRKLRKCVLRTAIGACNYTHTHLHMCGSSQSPDGLRCLLFGRITVTFEWDEQETLFIIRVINTECAGLLKLMLKHSEPRRNSQIFYKSSFFDELLVLYLLAS